MASKSPGLSSDGKINDSDAGRSGVPAVFTLLDTANRSMQQVGKKSLRINLFIGSVKFVRPHDRSHV